jgi:HD superfamily phosphohydrolase/serine/threonine protein kinase
LCPADVRAKREEEAILTGVEDPKLLDLGHVLAVLWRAAGQDPSSALNELRGDAWRPKPETNLQLALPHKNDVCGHELQIATDTDCQVGGGGVIIPCVETAAPDVRYALKVARPSLFSTVAKANAEARKARNEYLTHLPLSHENIAKMYAFEEVPVRREAHTLHLPCTLIEWVDGALPLHDHLHARVSEGVEVADLLTQTFRALAHLHHSGKIHWDVKSDNVLVNHRGIVKVTDLGNARPLRPEGSTYDDEEVAESTDLNLPIALQSRLRAKRAVLEARGEPVSLNRGPCDLRRGEPVWDRPWLDLYMLARDVNRSLAFEPRTLDLDDDVASLAEPKAPLARAAKLRERLFVAEDGNFVNRYLGRVVSRLLAVTNPSEVQIYSNADDVVQALERLRPEYGEATDIPELQPIPQHVIRVPPAENIPWTERVKQIMISAPLLRLRNHRQLATVHHVFPGAEHTRWEHALGTFEAVLQHIRALYADRSSVFFRLDSSKLDVTALMLASLLHDLGHPAFGHQMEESPVITEELAHEEYVLSVLRLCLTDNRSSGDDGMAAQDAEVMRPILARYWSSDDTPVEALIQRIIEILSAQNRRADGKHSDVPPRRIHTELLGSMIGGELDADKADYLARDAHHCGVEYGNGIDRRRLEQSLTSIVVRVGDSGRRTGMLAVTEKGIVPLESLLIARYQMFRAVYWHRTVRAMTVMLQDAIEQYVLNGNDADNGGRVKALISHFRELSDAEALHWLRSQLPEDSRGLCDGVAGDRRNIFKLVLELSGDEDLKHRRDLPFAAQDNATYERIVRLWSSVSPDGIEVVRRRRDLREALALNVSTELGDASGDLLPFSEVLVDVPVAGKDEVRHLYVARDRANERRAVPLETVTPLARAVATAFDQSVRPVRIFLSPRSIQRLCGTRDDEAELAEIIRKNLRELVDAQLQFPITELGYNSRRFRSRAAELGVHD